MRNTTRAYEIGTEPFRRVDYADQLIRLGHRGWYADDYSDVYRPVVYRLNHGRGFLAGYEESESGYVVLDLDIEETEDRAARIADDIAERAAEKERAYLEAWRARDEYETCQTESAEAWRDAVTLAASPKTDARDRAIRSLLKQRTRARADMARLADEWNHTAGWKDY